MHKINRLLVSAKYEAIRDAERNKHKEIDNTIGRMTTDQLRELAYGEPSDERLKEILSSVGGLSLLESG